MRTLFPALLLPLTMTLAACGGGTENPAVTDAADAMPNEIVDLPVEGNDAIGNESAVANEWTGRWIGPEGTYATILPDEEVGPGHYRINMKYGLDDSMAGDFQAVTDGETLRFTRPDGDQVLKRGDGAATGMKYLAEKSDCIYVKSGEGYCRD
ncbi:hypothetical protein ACPVPU_13865 [Sphingomonas sp. CJ99]